jgi:hypothetical protein
MFCFLLVVFVILLIVKAKPKNRHPYLRSVLDDKHIFDPSLFHNHNHCRIAFGTGFLTAHRYENRVLLYGSQGQHNQTLRSCGVTSTAIGDFHSAIHNYIVLHRSGQGPNDADQRSILYIPAFKGLHPKLRWNSQFEDPRLFQDNATGRLFVTATVLTPQSVRIAMVELDAVTLQYLKGTVLGKNNELGNDAPFPQKNWVLFNGVGQNDRQVYILTHALPEWSVYQVNLDTGALSHRMKVNSTSFFNSEVKANLFVRCSTGMIPWTANTLLTILHTREDEKGMAKVRAPNYRSIFVELDGMPPFRPLRKSRVIQFMKEDYRVEFAAGLCEKDGKTLYISLGLDDIKGETIEFQKRDVVTLFEQ